MPLKSISLKWIGFPNYIAYSNGTIFSLDKNLFLKPIVISTGYCRVTLYYKGKHKSISLHRLIFFSFRDNKRRYFNNSLYEIHHINGNKENNSLCNLTMAYYYEHLTKHHIKELLKQQKVITARAKEVTGFHIKCLTGLNKGKVFKSKAGLCRFLKHDCKKLHKEMPINKVVKINGIKYKRIK